MTPGSSVLFVLVRKATVDKVLDEVKGTGGKILKTSLSHDDEARLQEAFNAALITLQVQQKAVLKLKDRVAEQQSTQY